MLKPTIKQSEPISAGTHLAILYSIVDLGHQEVKWQGQIKLSPKIRLTWELPNEVKEFEGVKKPLVIGAQYTNSMGSLARLRPIVEGMLGVSLRDDEAANFDMDSYKELLGKACLLTVIHEDYNGKTFGNVATVSPLMKGMTIPKQFNENIIYEIGTSGDDVLQKLPEFIRKQIAKADENQAPELTDVNREALERIMGADSKKVAKKVEEEINPSDIPF